MIENTHTNRLSTTKQIIFKTTIIGILGSGGLFLFYYLTLLLITKDPIHPLSQMKLYQPWMNILILGFGIQIGLYYLLKQGIQFQINNKNKQEATAVAGTGAAVSGISMAACCAHHVADLIPILGISGAALFLTEYQQELLILGVIANAFGIIFMIWLLFNKENPKTILAYILQHK